jgi:hypothetical protein
MNALNNKKIVGDIFCDLQKAFDCVNHQILLAKMEFFGVTGNFLKLIQSYLEHRYQRVKIGYNQEYNTVFSKWKRITHGVLQGSVLGPLLFLIYINDLPITVKATSTPVLFADDTSVIVTSTNSQDFQDNIKLVLQQLNEWFLANFLLWNIDKTNIMLFKTKNLCNNEIVLNYRNKIITQKSVTKFLGLTLDSVLNWKTHIDNIFSKLSTASYTLRILKQIVSQDILIMTYFHSIMEYGIIFWGNYTYANKIFKLQKRIITGKKNRNSCRELFKNLKIHTLISQYIFSVVCFVINNQNEFIRNSEVHNINTRQIRKLHQPTTSLSLYQKGIINKGTEIYNNLPSYIKDTSANLNKFKSLLKNFLYSNSFYTLKEYFNYNET